MKTSFYMLYSLLDFHKYQMKDLAYLSLNRQNIFESFST